MKIYIYLSGLTFLMLGLELSAQKSIFQLEIDSPSALPEMDFTIDESLMIKSYSFSDILESQISNNEGNQSQLHERMYSQNPVMNDGYIQLERYADDYLFDSKRNGKGHVEARVLYYNYDYRFTAGSVVNTLSFGLGYLLGIPSARNIAELELELKIYNEDGEESGVYRGIGFKRSFGGLYYPRLDERRAHLRVMQEALEQVHQKIVADYPVSQVNP